MFACEIHSAERKKNHSYVQNYISVTPIKQDSNYQSLFPYVYRERNKYEW